MSKVIRINSETEKLIQEVKEKLMEGENEQIQEMFKEMTDDKLIKMSMKFMLKNNLVKNKK